MKQPSSPTLEFIHRHSAKIFLVLIVLTGIFFRLWRIHTLPPGLHPDEAANGLDIFRILEKHDFRPLYNTNGPREALFFYLQAIFVVIFGNTAWALRIAPALIGSAAVYVSYLWAKAWFSERIALLTAFLMAVTPWAVTLSRDGFRASMTPLMVGLVMWTYSRGLQTKRTKWFVWAGISLGAGMYTYLAFRLFPLVLLFMLGVTLLTKRSFLKPYWRQIGISLVAFGIVLLPMIGFGIAHPGDIGARAAGTSFLNKDLNHGHPAQTLLDNVVKTALMFNVRGDENFRHNLGGEPMLNFWVGIMFLIGLFLSISRLNRMKYLALLAVFGVMLLPEVLTAEGIPHALRSIGVMPVIFIFAAIGISWMLDGWYATFPVNSAARAAGLGMIALLLAATLYQGYNQYFVAWAQSPQTYEAYSEDGVQVAYFLNQHPFSGPRYVVIDGYSDKTVYYLTHNHATYTRVDAGDIAKLPTQKPVEFVIARSQKEAALRQLKDHFNGGKLTQHYSQFSQNELYDVYEVK